MNIIYADDEQESLDYFLSNHARDGMSVECVQDSQTLPELLNNRHSTYLPDVIVMDLYTTNDTINTIEAEKTNKHVDILINKMAKIREELAEYVEKKKTPMAIKVLKELRLSHKTKNIPVVIITREGLALLGDELVQESLEMGAEWMMKGRSPQTLRSLINRVYNKSVIENKRVKRDIYLMIGGIILGGIFSTILAKLI